MSNFRGDYSGVAYAHESKTSTTTATSPTAATLTSGPTRCQALLVSFETVAARYTIDGTTPVASGAGHPVAAGTTVLIVGESNCANFKFINDTGAGTTTARITFLRS